jgi:hypothetical protein
MNSFFCLFFCFFVCLFVVEVESCNEIADVVWVPSKFNVETFSRSGVNITRLDTVHNIFSLISIITQHERQQNKRKCWVLCLNLTMNICWKGSKCYWCVSLWPLSSHTISLGWIQHKSQISFVECNEVGAKKR